MIEWLGFTTPSLAALGLLAIASPIVIHLLNRRRFKTINWAAMEFLLDADKKNRRRVRLENLLLLLLRCLAMLLLGLVLARPYLESALTGRLVDTPRFERIILLDDSLSMQAQSNNQSSMDVAKRGLAEILRGLASNDSEDLLTLIVTSQPDSPIVNSEPVTPDTIEQRIAETDQLQASDETANLDVALQEVQRLIHGREDQLNQVVYLLSDMRQRDWQLDRGGEDENQPIGALRRIAGQVSGCFVVDVAAPDQRNLVVTEIRPEATLIADVMSRFDVTVRNAGQQPAENLRVQLTAGDSIPLQEQIGRIEAGQSETVQFNVQFAADEFDDPLEDELGQLAGHITSPVRMTAQVVTEDTGELDQLLADSQRYFAARVARGIPTLVVDGDPSAARHRSESFYLRPALDPPGNFRSGVAVDVVTDTEMESVTLSRYQVVFLCNVYRLSEGQVESLRQWTEAGGGLVILPGDQVDDDDFNRQFFDAGKGLSPIRLDGLQGDESHRSWVDFRIEQPIHLVLRIFEDQNNPFLDRVKIFRWWASSISPEMKNQVSVLARLTDEDDSIAIAEKAFGDGRVVAMAIPGDADWTNWTDDPSFLITMQELVRYLAGDKSGETQLRVGEPLRQPIDLVEFRENALLELPDDDRVNVQAVHWARPADPSRRAAPSDPPPSGSTVRQIEFPDISRRGFYQLQLTRTSGGMQQMLFAANVDPAEGLLERLDESMLRQLAGDRIRVVTSSEAAAQSLRGSKSEIWRYLLVAAVVILCGEQFLGWLFGKRR